MKKAFTLIELLAVIVILGILTTIAVTTISSSITSSRKKTKDELINDILKSAQAYSFEKYFEGDYTVCVQTLKDNGYLKNDIIKDPLTNKELNGYVKFTYDSYYNQYDLEYVDEIIQTCE